MRLGARIGALAAGLLVIAAALFALPARLPGGMETGLLGANANDPIARNDLRVDLHLERAEPVPFLDFLGDVMEGDLGYSPVRGADVGAVVGERLLESVLFAAATLGIAFVLRARRFGRRTRRRARVLAPSSLPGGLWWLPLLGLLFVARGFGGVPTAGPHAAIVTRAGASLMPAILLGCALALWTSIARRPRRDVIAAVTIGTLVTEVLFGVPGVGSLLAEAAAAPDPLTTRGALLAVSAVVLVASVAWLPPRGATGRAAGAVALPGPSVRGRAWRGSAAALWVVALVAAVVARGNLGLPAAGHMTGRGVRGISPAHPFGSDAFGRDVLARALATARGSLLLVVAALVIATVAGGAIGVVIGFAGGRFERLGIALLAGWAAFPGELVALALLAFNGRAGTAAAIALAFVAAPALAAGAHRRTLQAVRASDASLETGAWLRSFGSRVSFGMLRATLATMFVGAGRVLGAELVAGLLGFGPAATQTWSHELTSQLPFAAHSPQAVAAPALVALLTACALTTLGNALRPGEKGFPSERASEASGAT